MYGVLVLAPLDLSLSYSFTNRNLLFPPAEFVGLDNYIRLFADATFPPALPSPLGSPY